NLQPLRLARPMRHPGFAFPEMQIRLSLALDDPVVLGPRGVAVGLIRLRGLRAHSSPTVEAAPSGQGRHTPRPPDGNRERYGRKNWLATSRPKYPRNFGARRSCVVPYHSARRPREAANPREYWHIQLSTPEDGRSTRRHLR